MERTSNDVRDNGDFLKMKNFFSTQMSSHTGCYSFAWKLAKRASWASGNRFSEDGTMVFKSGYTFIHPEWFTTRKEHTFDIVGVNACDQ